MNKIIAFSPWILLIVICGSSGFKNGTYQLDEVKIYYYDDERDDVVIPSTKRPVLRKNDDNYSVTFRSGKKEETIDFKILQVVTLIESKVYIDPDDDLSRLVLDFRRFEFAQQLYDHEKASDWRKEAEFNLLGVFETEQERSPPKIISNGKLLIEKDPQYQCGRFTIIDRNDGLPRFVFHTANFNVSKVIEQSYLLLTIAVSIDEFEFALKFASAKEAASFHELVARRPHVDPAIEVSIPQHMNAIIEIP